MPIDPTELALPENIPAALLAYKKRLQDIFGERLKLLALFGSWARGETTEDSDIDVFVSIDHADWRDMREAAGTAGDIAVEIGVWLSPVIYSTDRFKYLLEIDNL